MSDTAARDDHDARQQGVALIRASKAYEDDRPAYCWLLLLTTLALWGLALTAVLLVEPWPMKILAGFIAGLIQSRLFIFYHDALHGAIFRKRRVAQFLMSAFGWYSLSVRSVWQETHDFHHQHNTKLSTSSIGSYVTVSTDQARKMSRWQRFQYRAIRNGITMVLGGITVFLFGLSWTAFKRNPRKHWQAPLAALTFIAIVVAAVMTLGWANGLCLVVVPSATMMMVGAYLFYAQHNFPEVKLQRREEWNFADAAMHGSSFFKMSPMMHWFTGNIGYHHVHHLNHRIPFYNLPKAMAEMPELQNPGTTSWSLKDIWACLRCFAWDWDEARMLTSDETFGNRYSDDEDAALTTAARVETAA